MKVYLAGKIRRDNDWRQAVTGFQSEGRWWVPADGTVPSWPILKGVVFGQHDYTGPYFMDEGHGAAHGPGTHGVGDETCYAGPYPDRREVVRLCFDAIREADLVFAWLDDPTAYGTLVEIGYAKALGKIVVIGAQEAPHRPSHIGHGQYCACDCLTCRRLGDLWFAFHAGPIIESRSPGDALRIALMRAAPAPPPPKFDSPLEEAFWAELQQRPRPALTDIVTQHPVDLGSGIRYRLDFAIPGKKVGIELDGFTYHGSKDAFNADRRRQRNLELDGWRIIRFTGDEVRANVAACVNQAAAFAARLAA